MSHFRSIFLTPHFVRAHCELGKYTKREAGEDREAKWQVYETTSWLEAEKATIAIPRARNVPVQNLSSQLTHWELTLKLMVGLSWGRSVSSQWTHKMIHTVSLLWAFLSLRLTQWAHCYLCMVSSSGWSPEQLTISSRCEFQTPRKLTARSHCELILWVHYELT